MSAEILKVEKQIISEALNLIAQKKKEPRLSDRDIAVSCLAEFAEMQLAKIPDPSAEIEKVKAGYEEVLSDWKGLFQSAKEGVKERDELLLKMAEALQNMSGIFDNPVARRNNDSEYAIEARKSASEALKAYEEFKTAE